jgi:hypothetical protein
MLTTIGAREMASTLFFIKILTNQKFRISSLDTEG